MNKGNLVDIVKDNIKSKEVKEQIKISLLNKSLNIFVMNKKTIKPERLDPVRQLIVLILCFSGYMPFNSLSKIMSPFYNEDELEKVLKDLSELEEEVKIEGADRRKKAIKKDELERLQNILKNKNNDDILLSEEDLDLVKRSCEELTKKETKIVKKDYILHKEKHSYLGDVYMLSTKTLKMIEGTKKASLYEMPKHPNALDVKKLKSDYLAQRVIEEVLKELEKAWINLTEDDKKIYLKKAFIKYISADEFFKWNKSDREAYLNNMGNKKNTAILIKATNIDDDIRNKYLDAVLKSLKIDDYALRVDKLNSFLNNVNRTDDKRIRFFLLQDLIKDTNTQIDCLSIVKRVLFGEFSNLLVDNNKELRDKISNLCNIVIKENNLKKNDYPEAFKHHNEIAEFQSLKTIYGNIAKDKNKRKKSIHKLKDEGKYTKIDADELKVLVAEIEALDKLIEKLDLKITQLQYKNRFCNPKKSINNKEKENDKNPCITFETMISNKVYVENADIKNKKLIIDLVGFDASGGNYDSEAAMKKIFGTTEMLKGIIDGSSQYEAESIQCVIVNYKLVHSSDSPSTKYNVLYINIIEFYKKLGDSFSEGSSVPKPDNFDPLMIEGFLSKEEYIRKLI